MRPEPLQSDTKVSSPFVMSRQPPLSASLMLSPSHMTDKLSVDTNYLIPCSNIYMNTLAVLVDTLIIHKKIILYKN